MKSELCPASRLGEVLAKLAGAGAPPQPPESIVHDGEALGDWLEAAARSMGLEAQHIEISYSGLDELLATLRHAIIRVGNEFLILGPGRPAPPAAAIRSMLCGEAESGAIAQIQPLLDRAGIPREKQSRAREALLRERLANTRLRGIWQVRLPPGARFGLHLRREGIPQRLLALAAAHAIQYFLWIAAWWVVGRNVLGGRMEQGWLLTWSLLILSMIPPRVLITWWQGCIAIATGGALKLRLLYGALRLDPDSIRHQGTGQLLGQVLESEAVEALALSGGFLALVAAIELAAAAFVLGMGAGGFSHAALLAMWLAVTAVIARQYFQRNRAWTDVRLRMTHELVENMAGHRTRLAQLPPDRWHEGEEAALRQYLEASQSMDRWTTCLLAVTPRGWLLLGLFGLAPAYLAGAKTSSIAISVGGLLLAYRALRRFTAGTWQIAGAAVAWERVGVLFRSAARPEVNGSLELAARHEAGPAVVDARNLVFRYGDRSEPVLRGCNLVIRSGDRVLMEGPSGGGKSTLVSLLLGVREPDSGNLLVDGFERAALGAQAWRKRIAAAPQFHENHVLTGTFAFNLFMGRAGRPTAADVMEAEEVCEELGLGDLLARMPARMLQPVGETGWQLSHGERSRLYIARAILQAPEVVVLDESFAALDPENLKRALECTERRAKTLLVIAHR